MKSAGRPGIVDWGFRDDDMFFDEVKSQKALLRSRDHQPSLVDTIRPSRPCVNNRKNMTLMQVV